jgi:hypothetical protein
MSLVGTVYRGSQGGFSNQAPASVMLNTLGEQIVMDWMQKAVLDGMVYQIRAGTVTTPLVGDVAITDTAAEMAVDAASATTIIPLHHSLSINLGTGTLHEYATKSVATVSSSGTAFTPLNMRSDGTAASITARVQAAGAVTVTAELATTTLRHWSWDGAIAMGAYTLQNTSHTYLPAPVLVGARSFYMQVAATGTGPSYFAAIEVMQVATANVVL